VTIKNYTKLNFFASLCPNPLARDQYQLSEFILREQHERFSAQHRAKESL